MASLEPGAAGDRAGPPRRRALRVRSSPAARASPTTWPRRRRASTRSTTTGPSSSRTSKPWGLPRKMREQFVLRARRAAAARAAGRGARQAARRARRAVRRRRSCTSRASGIGFIAVELALLQHLTLLLGHPIFTLSILLFTLLAAGGVGSLASGRFRLGSVCLATAAVAALYALALPRVVPALLPLPLPARIAIAILLVAPLGFLMGMPFPKGLRATGSGPVPGAASLLGHERPLLGRRLDGDDGDRRDLRLHLGDARRSLLLPGGRAQLARAQRSPARSVIR